MRIINPKRDTATGDLYYFCPITTERVVASNNMKSGSRMPCCGLCTIELKATRYVITNAAVTDEDLIEFDPPKAHDTYRGLKGVSVIHSPDHTWVEPKLDGARAIVHCTSNGVVITTRRRDRFGKFSQIQDNVPHLRDHPDLVAIGKLGYTILDGELIMPVDTDTLAVTMGVVGALPAKAIALQRVKGLARLHLFDMPHHLGKSVVGMPLSARRAMLQELNLDPPGHLIELVHHAIDTTADYRAQALRYQLAHGKEGLVIKIPTATYFQSQAWLKVKQRCTYDCIITGFEFGKVGGKYEDTVGALKVAVTDSTNSELREICKVIPGDDATRDRLLAKLADLAQSEIVNLGLIAELEAQCITKDGRLRHPRIIRWRTDRSAPNTVNFADGSVVG